jgi:glutaminyl-tRNA synthetase
VLQRPLPQQIEFSRLNLSYIVLSKRKLIQLVDEKHVAGWDDPRLPTLVGARRRGYPAEGFRRFAERIGASRSDSLIEYSQLEDTMREVLNASAERRIAVLDPLRLIIDNYPEGQSEECLAPNHPLKPGAGQARDALRPRAVDRARRFHGAAEQGLPSPLPRQSTARLRYGYVVRCTGCEHDASGAVSAVHCEYLPDSKSGTPAPTTTRSRAICTGWRWPTACLAEVRLYDRLFAVPSPGADARATPRASSATSATTSTRTASASSRPGSSQRSRMPRRRAFPVRTPRLLRRRPGRFEAGAPVFNRTVTLRDSWIRSAPVRRRVAV